MGRKIEPAAARGVTLVELLLVCILLAILVSLGQPLLQPVLHRNQLYTAVSSFLDALRLARSEAVLRNAPVSICPSGMARNGQPDCAGVYADGWVVFVNPDRDRKFDRDRDEVLRVFEALPAGYSLTNRAGTRPAADLISYLPDGTTRRNLSLLFCPPDTGRVSALAIVLNIVGRPRLALGWGTCP